MRCYVIGDIHGCLDELRYLVEGLPLESGDRLVFLGDYVDRGPNSKGVLTYVLQLQQRGDLELICLKGNHEDMFLAYLGLAGQHGDMFLYNGGYATLISYGVNSKQSSLDEITSHIPPDHLEFLKNLRMYFVMEPFICVHAGINPSKPLAKQTDVDLLWIRDEFIHNPHRLPYTVIFGHTPGTQCSLISPIRSDSTPALFTATNLAAWRSLRKCFIKSPAARRISSES